MKLQDYALTKPGKKRYRIYRSVTKLDFPIDQLQFMTIPDNSELEKMVDSMCPATGPLDAKHHARLKTIVEAWCERNCSGRWSKLGGPTTWVFELPEDAIMFKFVWYNAE